MERDYNLIPEGQSIDDGKLSPIILVVNKLQNQVIEAIQGPYAEILDDPEIVEIYGKAHDAVSGRYPYNSQSEIDLIYVNVYAGDDVKRKLRVMLPQYSNWDDVELIDFRKYPQE